MGQFFEAVFSLDNRLFRTLAALAVPGRLTKYFLSGKQKPYFHPFRLFFFSGILMVAAFTLYTSQKVGDSLEREHEENRAEAYQHRYNDSLRVRLVTLQSLFPEDTTVAAASDSLLKLVGYIPSENKDSIDLGTLEYQGDFTFISRGVRISYDDSRILSTTELVEKYEVEGVVDQYIFKQVVRSTRMSLRDITTMMGQIIWGLLVLIPLVAGLMKLLYARRKKRYVEHFVFLLHTHAFLFVALLSGALGLLLADNLYVLAIGQIAAVLYFILALKRVYKQNWFKTLLKAALLGIGYAFLLVLCLSFTTILAFLLF